MDVIVERPAALDVDKAQVTACVRVPGEDGQRRSEVREFSTVVGGLLVLRDWLKAHGVTKVAMEATSVYWRPVWAVLEDDFELLVVNARHVKNLPAARPTSRMSSGCASCLKPGFAGELRAAQADPGASSADPVSKPQIKGGRHTFCVSAVVNILVTFWVCQRMTVSLL